jgi:hypothetical protein
LSSERPCELELKDNLKSGRLELKCLPIAPSLPNSRERSRLILKDSYVNATITKVGLYGHVLCAALNFNVYARAMNP